MYSQQRVDTIKGLKPLKKKPQKLTVVVRSVPWDSRAWLTKNSMYHLKLNVNVFLVDQKSWIAGLNMPDTPAIGTAHHTVIRYLAHYTNGSMRNTVADG